MTAACRRALLALLAACLGWTAPAAAQISIMAEEPVVAAVKAGDGAALQRALLRGDSPNTRDAVGIPALCIAAQFGNQEAVKMLIDFQATVDQPDTEGNTALAHAATRGHLAIARTLLVAKAQIDRENRQGESPLILAARLGHADVVAELLQAGAAVNAADYAGHTAYYYARVNRHHRIARLLKDSGGRD